MGKGEDRMRRVVIVILLLAVLVAVACATSQKEVATTPQEWLERTRGVDKADMPVNPPGSETNAALAHLREIVWDVRWGDGCWIIDFYVYNVRANSFLYYKIGYNVGELWYYMGGMLTATREKVCVLRAPQPPPLILGLETTREDGSRHNAELPPFWAD